MKQTGHKHEYDEGLRCRWCGHSIRLNGAWPQGTWYQLRLAQIRIKAALEASDLAFNDGKGESK